MNRPRIGYALSGGVVHGAAHLGFLAAFQDAGIRPDAIAGTSAGVIIGAGYAAGVSVECAPAAARVTERAPSRFDGQKHGYALTSRWACCRDTSVVGIPQRVTTKGGHMGILSWIVIGGLAGLAARFVTKRRLGLIVTVIVGIIGAVVGGWLLTAVTHGPGLTGFSFRSFLIAFAGAVVLLFAYGLVTGRSRRSRFWRLGR